MSQRPDNLFIRMLMAGLNHPRPTLILLLSITLITGLGLPALKIDTGFDSLVPASDPDKQVYEQVVKEFGTDNRTLVYVRDEQLWTPEKLALLERLHHALVTLPAVERVDGLFTLRSIRGKADGVESRLLLATVPATRAEADKARQDALYNPLVIGNYLSRDGKVTALMVSIREEEARPPGFERQVNMSLEQAIQPFRDDFDTLFQIGPPRINAELKASLFHDLTLLGPLSVFLLVATILFFLRSPFAAIVPVITSLISIVWVFGLMGWTGLPVNILIAMLPSLVVVIGSTEDTHMMSAYLHGMARGEAQGRDAATRYMLRHMAIPLLLTVITTSLGFASNMITGIGLIQDFAIAASLAILANGVITILLVPILLSRLGPVSQDKAVQQDRVRGIPALMVRLFGASNNRLSKWVLFFTALLCAFFVYQASKLHVSNDPMSYFRGSQPLIQQARLVQRDLAGTKVFFITLQSDQENAFLEPGNLKKLRKIQDFLQEQGVFDLSVSLADHVALINREFHGGDENYREIPAKRELVAQYLMFLHRHDIDDYVSHDMKRATILVRHDISDSAILNRNIEELRDVVNQIAGGDMRAFVVGENLMINAAAETLMLAQVKSLGLLLLAIFLIMSVMFTSPRGGLISLVPSLIPIILMFGIMGLLGIPLNPGTAMVAVIAIGIAVDSTIHLFSRYNELCRRTPDYQQAVEQTVREESTPVVATSLALALGFGILLFSNFTLVAQFGALSAATMLFSIFANLLITPIIMSRIRLVGLHQILALSTRREVLDESPLFEGMTDYQVRKAILISELHEFDAGQRIIEQGATGRSMYLILEGEAEVVRRDDGREQFIARLTPGQVFGEIGFISETERTADVRALTPVSVLRFDYEKIRQDLKLFPHIIARINYNISCILGRRLADTLGQRAGAAQGGGPTAGNGPGG